MKAVRARWVRALCALATLTLVLSVFELPSAGAAPPAGASSPAASNAPLLSPAEYKDLEAAWREVRSDLARQAWAEAAGRHQHLVDIRRDLGLPNVYALSGVLLKAARDASDEGGADAAEDLVAAAVALSPDMSSGHFERARVVFERDAFAVSDQIRAIRTGFERLGDDLAGWMGFFGNSISAATWLLIGVLTLFALAMLLRHWRTAIHDVRRMLPAGVTPLQAGLLLGLVMVAPFFAGFGLVATGVVWLALTSIYQRPMERVASLLLVVALAGLPTATAYVVRALSADASSEAVVQRCNASACAASDRRRLERWAKSGDNAYEAHFTLGLVARRAAAAAGAGRFETAREHLVAASRLKDTPEVHAELGHVTYLEALGDCTEIEFDSAEAIGRYEGRLNAALEHWKKALALEADHLPSLYNAGVVSAQLGNEQDAGRYSGRALELEPERVATWNRDVAKDNNVTRCALKQQNRHLMSATISPSKLREGLMAAQVPNDGIVIPFSGLFTGRLAVKTLSIIGLAAAALILLLWFMVAAIKPSRACRECGAVAGPRERLDVGRTSICEECILADINRGIVDAKVQWIREQRIHDRQSRRARTPRLVTWILPGFGHLLRGAPIRGVIIMVLVFGSLLVGFGLTTVVEDYRQPHDVGTGRVFLFGLIAGITYLLALIDAHTGRSGS